MFCLNISSYIFNKKIRSVFRLRGQYLIKRGLKAVRKSSPRSIEGGLEFRYTCNIYLFYPIILSLGVFLVIRRILGKLVCVIRMDLVSQRSLFLSLRLSSIILKKQEVLLIPSIFLLSRSFRLCLGTRSSAT